MTINSNTKIAAVIKQDPRALEALISVSPKFEKLRNPFMRKIMAGRTSLSMAAKIGGCTVDVLFKKLELLGFAVDRTAKITEQINKGVPQFITGLKKERLTELDVRPEIASGKDPLNLIMEKIKSLQRDQVLKIINSFEPTPLILLLERKGFQSYVDVTGTDRVDTYFYNAGAESQPLRKKEEPVKNTWEEVLERFSGRLQKTDVRHLEMPQPMMVILEALEKLPPDNALYVYHKRIPVFLLPELVQRDFEYRIKEISEGEVHLLIFKNSYDFRY